MSVGSYKYLRHKHLSGSVALTNIRVFVMDVTKVSVSTRTRLGTFQTKGVVYPRENGNIRFFL